MFIMLRSLMGWSTENGTRTNQLDYEYERKKKIADRYTEAKNAISNEKDPVKREKMSMRFALGVTDFSDL